MDLSGVLVTRGNVSVEPIIDTWREAGIPEAVVWDNGAGTCTRTPLLPIEPDGASRQDVADLGVYGRYAAIEHATCQLIYVQDDDCILTPQSIEDIYVGYVWTKGCNIASNMPERFRPHYSDSCLVGFGAVFHRSAPARAFNRFGFDMNSSPFPDEEWSDYTVRRDGAAWTIPSSEMFRRTCDVVFTTLTEPRELLDVAYADREFASDPDRMWRQPDHYGERQQMLAMARDAKADGSA